MAHDHDHEHEHDHGHGHVHLDEAHWEAFAEQTEREGELLAGFVTGTAWVVDLRAADAPPVRRVLDIGSGPGVGTAELARCFPGAEVVAIDGSPAMLERASQRAAAHGLDDRISTHLAELPDGLDGLEPADVIWASMSLHHVGDETTALRLLGQLLVPTGLLAIAEIAEPLQTLPDALDVGRPGLAERLDRAEAAWFESMRSGLSGSVASADVEVMLAAAGLEVAGSRIDRVRFEPPLPDAARRFVAERLERTRRQLTDAVDAEDRDALGVLCDPDDPRGVMHRADVFVHASRHIVIARPRPRR